VEKFKARRAALLDIINDQRASDEAREEARAKLQKLPRDASPVRLRNRCALTGRRAASTASSAWDATSCASSRCAARCRA
jgi:hypothetical protein